MQITSVKPTISNIGQTRSANAPVTTKTWSDSTVTWSGPVTLWGVGDSVMGEFPNLSVVQSVRPLAPSIASVKP